MWGLFACAESRYVWLAVTGGDDSNRGDEITRLSVMLSDATAVPPGERTTNARRADRALLAWEYASPSFDEEPFHALPLHVHSSGDVRHAAEYSPYKSMINVDVLSQILSDATGKAVRDPDGYYDGFDTKFLVSPVPE